MIIAINSSVSAIHGRHFVLYLENNSPKCTYWHLELVGLFSLLFLNFLTWRGGEEERRRGGESVRCEELN